ncbi:hypothetical protein LCGC14_0988680 [marine sediment metagenome]|uniref:Uncharacterized protein n=2 Tax=marine sediment metagenome TaxID=412755 RepID=A0A0F9NB32_9ZZZZ
MTKLYIVTHEYEHCGECANCGFTRQRNYRCDLKRKLTPDIWGDIPSWCPLPDKKEG